MAALPPLPPVAEAYLYAEGQEAMELAEALVAEAQREHRATAERLGAALRALARACRERLRTQEAELGRLREENARLRAALLQAQPVLPLAGRCVLVLGDPRHAAGYRELLGRYGAEAMVCDGQDPHAARPALRGRYDAVVLVTAWTASAVQVQELVRKHQPRTRLVFVNRCGVGGDGAGTGGAAPARAGAPGPGALSGSRAPAVGKVLRFPRQQEPNPFLWNTAVVRSGGCSSRSGPIRAPAARRCSTCVCARRGRTAARARCASCFCSQRRCCGRWPTWGRRRSDPAERARNGVACLLYISTDSAEQRNETPRSRT